MERTRRFRRSDNKKFTLATIKRTLTQPLFYFFITLYPAAVLAQQGYNCEFRSPPSTNFDAETDSTLDFTLYLKSLKHVDGTQVWSTAAVNAIPIGGAAIICEISPVPV